MRRYESSTLGIAQVEVWGERYHIAQRTSREYSTQVHGALLERKHAYGDPGTCASVLKIAKYHADPIVEKEEYPRFEKRRMILIALHGAFELTSQHMLLPHDHKEPLRKIWRTL